MAGGLRRGKVAMLMSLRGDEFGCDGAFGPAIPETLEVADEGHE